ncbi:MAG: DNA polymerase III subunit alpha [Planctomycetes bacterium ADurb.Bin126]|nr:MAG: DNA polymerase III subunit alpha [Planctomycetes bacterium ADurb.Bin126]HOD80569.1 PHP domain-containing protein [Phycisphaerae bacterium]HQL72410.1 PHP domain-containing protein [Phycisphaerae bacterium]
MICARDNSIAPLHARSGYSLLRGSARVEDLIARAVELGHRRLALTDVNGLYGLPRFYALAREADLEPIVGAELEAPGLSAIALIDEPIGYENLCRVLTAIHGPLPHDHCPPNEWDWSDLCRGLHLIVQDEATARRLLEGGAQVERVWLGVDPATQRGVDIERLEAASRRLDLPPVALGRALMARADELEVARLLAAIREGTTFDNVPAALLPHPRAFLRRPAELAGELAGEPACLAEAAANNRRLAERCASFRFLPRSPVFPAYPCPGGASGQDYLRALCTQGMEWRYGQVTAAAVHRLERELALIRKMGFCEYFLVVWDIVRYARDRGVPLAGRGSGASSLVAYLLGITNVCPLAFDIPFERFLNERRGDFPDLDIDFCWRIRDDVIAYAFARWGVDRAAMVSVHTTFQPASATRETAKAMGYSDDQIRGQSTNFTNFPNQVARLSRRLLGLPHVLSVHPGGVVLAPGPIDRYAPIQRAAKGVAITHFDKDGVEAVGLVKLDLLGNRSLSTLRCACDLITRRTGRTIDVETLGGDDPATLATLQAADTVGCNQLESPAMRHLLRAMRPRHVGDVMKALALIRPGAASIGMKETFIRRHRERGLAPNFRGNTKSADNHGPEIRCLSPFADILRPTHGIMLYEDDVMLVAAALMGCSLAEGDRFRKAVQKCRDDAERVRLSREFLARCRGNGVDAQLAKDLWVQMAKFNAYSFCRAHAASYAQLAYAMAYLRTHWPLEFYVAALNNNQSMYHPRVYVEQAKREGIRFLLPDVNASQEEFSCEGPAIRTGLSRVGGLGPVSAETILAARRRGAFEGLSHFVRRTGLAREEIRSLILCGAMDAFARTRPELMMELDLCLAGPRDDAGGPLLLPVAPSLGTTLDDYSPRRKYLDERRVLGFSVREHILAGYRPALAGRTDADSRDLPRRVARRVRLAGVIEAHRTTSTQKGATMHFLTLDDEHGLFDVTVFPDVARGIGALSRDRYGPWLVTGTVEEQYDVVTVTAEKIEWVEAAAAPREVVRCWLAS